MGHHIHAVVGKADVLRSIAQELGLVGVVPLAQGFGLVPIREEDADRFHESAAGTDQPDFEWLLPGFAKRLRQASADTPLAYIETEYHGGTGTQRAIVWLNGAEAATLPATSDESADSRLWPINRALVMLGVQRTGDADEFETLGLGKHRREEDWVALVGGDTPAEAPQSNPASRDRAGAGCAIGLLVWLVVLGSLFALRPLVLLPAPDDGGRGGHIEALWMLVGWAPCLLIGLAWPSRIGPRIRRLFRCDAKR